MARRANVPSPRHLLTPPSLPPYRRPKANKVPVKTKADEDEHPRSSVASDDAKAGFYQPWNPEPIYPSGPYLWNANDKPPRMYSVAKLALLTTKN